MRENEKRGVAIVTGATGGMGAPAVKRLAAQGWPLILCDIDETRLELMASLIREVGLQVDILAGDMAERGFPDRLIAAIGERQVGALIHTAGLSPTMGDPARILAVNYDATVRLVDAVRPRMAAGSCAVLVASMAGHQMHSPEIDAAIDALGTSDDSSPLLNIAMMPEIAYGVSKRGVQRIVEREAKAFGERGARIASISPGLIDTPMGRAEKAAQPLMENILQMTPLGRYGVGDEIASVAVFLCSPDASYVSGCDIKVDGGVMAAMRG
jgi:NAD(P)-dependent dehydrogenase (short-subunit alcohol dehydrogenase family)